MSAGEVVTRDQLLNDAWDGELLKSGSGALRTQVRRLRAALDEKGVGDIVETASDGYRLAIDRDSVDIFRAEFMLDEAMAALDQDAAHATDLLRSAWELLNAEPLQGLEDFDFAGPAISRFRSLAEVARLQFARALLTSGDAQAAVDLLSPAVSADPLAAEPVALLVDAHRLAGRPHDSLAVADAHREAMLDVGLIVSEQVRNAENFALGVDELDDGGPSALIGRSDECAVLADALEALTNDGSRGRGQAITVVGEAGVGKSELMSWLADSARALDVPLLQGAGDPFGNDFPLLAVREALSTLPTARDVIDGSIDRSPTAGDPDILQATNDASLQWQRLAVAEGVIAALESSIDRPHVMVVDDMHWVDESSRAVLRAISRFAARAPLLLVMAGRPEGGWINTMAASSIRNLMPAPMERQDGRLLAEAQVGAPLGPLLAEAVDRAGGVPLLIVELIRGLRSERRLVVGQTVDLIGDTAPTSIQELVRRRLATLPGDAKRLCEVTALLGAEARIDNVGQLLEATPLELNELITIAVDADLLSSSARLLAYRHDLVREAVVESMPATQRADLHRQMATLHADRGSPITAVAAHAALAAAFEDDRQLVDWLREAADSTSMLEPLTSLRFIDRALEIGPADVETRYGLLRAKVEAFTNSGQVMEAASLLDSVLEINPDRAADALLRLAGLKLLSDDVTDAKEVLLRGLARDPEEPIRSRLHSLVGLVSMIMLQQEDAYHWAAEAERLGAECGDLVARSVAAGVRGRMRCLSFEDGALADNQRSVEFANADPTGQAHGYQPYSFLCMAAVDLGLHDEAERAIAGGREVAARVHTPWAGPVLQALEMLIFYRRAKADEVRATASEILERRSLVGAGMVDSWAATMLAAVALRDGDVDEARRWMDVVKAEEAPNSLGDDFGVCVDAQLLAIDGDLEAAFEHVAGAWEICDLIGLKIWYQVMAGTAIRLGLLVGDRERVEKMAQDCEWIRDRTGAPIHEALAMRTRALVDGDVGAMRQAVELYRATDWALETSDAEAELAAMEAGDLLPATFLPAD